MEALLGSAFGQLPIGGGRHPGLVHVGFVLKCEKKKRTGRRVQRARGERFVNAK
jgi:hypothetical protein